MVRPIRLQAISARRGVCSGTVCWFWSDHRIAQGTRTTGSKRTGAKTCIAVAWAVALMTAKRATEPTPRERFSKRLSEPSPVEYRSNYKRLWRSVGCSPATSAICYPAPPDGPCSRSSSTHHTSIASQRLHGQLGFYTITTLRGTANQATSILCR